MKYIVLLRGINISGKNKIPMPILKSILQEHGFGNVTTYLNSGNIILDSNIENKSALSQKIFDIIKENFSLEIPNFITTDFELAEVIGNSPSWWNTEDKSIYNNLIFIMPPMTYKDVFAAAGEPSENTDKIKEYKNYIYWSFDLNNYKQSNWWIKTASTNIKDKITI